MSSPPPPPPPRSTTTSRPPVSVSAGTARSSTTGVGGKVGSKTMDEAVTEDQREAVTPAAIRLNHGNPLMNDELEIPGIAARVEQSGLPT